MTVRILKGAVPRLTYSMEVVTDDGDHLVLRGEWAGGAARDVGYVTFEPGDTWTEHYWTGRWYSIKHIADSAGASKGWYCDVIRPVERTAEELVVVDLDLDLWVSPDGSTVLPLDEDEFTDSGLAIDDPAAAEQARAAMSELARLAASGFDCLDTPTTRR